MCNYRSVRPPVGASVSRDKSVVPDGAAHAATVLFARMAPLHSFRESPYRGQMRGSQRAARRHPYRVVRLTFLSSADRVPSHASGTDTRTDEARGAEAPRQRTARGR